MKGSVSSTVLAAEEEPGAPMLQVAAVFHLEIRGALLRKGGCTGLCSCCPHTCCGEERMLLLPRAAGTQELLSICLRAAAFLLTPSKDIDYTFILGQSVR